MLVGVDGASLNGQPMISAFPGGVSSNHHNSISMTRTQTGKMHNNFKVGARAMHEAIEDTTPNDSSNNVFMHENRMANTLNRG